MGDSWFTQRAAGVGVGVGVGALVGWWAWRRASTHPDTPTQWEEVGEVSQLVVYPLKSGRGVKVTEAEATRFGLALGLLEDRSFVALEDFKVMKGKFDPPLFGVTLTLEGSEVTLQAQEMEEALEFDLQDVVRRGEVTEVTYMRETLGKGYDCGKAAAAWLTKALKKKKSEVRLVYHGDLTRERKALGSLTENYKTVYVFPGFRVYDRMIYAEDAPYLLTSDASLADLNARMLDPVTQDCFRSNIVVSGVAKAYDEDDWAFVRVGDVVFRRIKPCGRYVYVDPESGLRAWEGGEHIKKTLALTHRMEGPPVLQRDWKSSPVFGSYLGVDRCGRVRVGDKVGVARASHNPRWQL